MIKNSPKRLVKRRQGALARRLVNREDATQERGYYAARPTEVLASKLSIINTDIESLNKKGIR